MTKKRRVEIYSEQDSTPRGLANSYSLYVLQLADGSVRLSDKKTGRKEKIWGYFTNGDQFFSALCSAIAEQDIPLDWIDKARLQSLLSTINPTLANQLAESYRIFLDQEEQHFVEEDDHISRIMLTGTAGGRRVPDILERFYSRYSDKIDSTGKDSSTSPREHVRAFITNYIRVNATLPRDGVQILPSVYVDIPWLRQQLLMYDAD